MIIEIPVEFIECFKLMAISIVVYILIFLLVWVFWVIKGP